MKKYSILASLLLGFVTASVQAGTETYKQVAPPPPPPPMYGIGFYGAIDAGANVYQNRGGDRIFSSDNDGDSFDRDLRFFGSTLDVSPKNDVGFFGGIKLGYVFGTGWVRPTIEGDFFYNGFRGGADFTLNEAFTPSPLPAGFGTPGTRFPTDQTVFSTHQRNVTTWINTGAFLANFILRFGAADSRFQPYVGAGVGGYYAESAGVEVQDPVTGTTPINTGGGKNHADLAWQVVAGADYFFNPQWSAFVEYHYLDYTSTQINTRESRDLGQHLVGAGVRFFFH